MDSVPLKIMLAAVMVLAAATRADEAEALNYELNLTGGYSDVDGATGTNGTNLKNSVGFEYFRVFSDDYGDTLKLNLQMRFVYDSRFDSEEAFGVEIHNAWLDYKIGLGKTLRAGHFAPAFGLESVLDTHGTMLQTLNFENIGYKKDWGVGYRTYWGDFDVEMAAQLGSGMGIRQKDNNYLLSTRVSSVTESGLEYGFSFLHGRTLRAKQSWTIPVAELASDESVRRNRAGIDIQCPLGPFRFLGEFAAGDDDGETVGGGMAQLEYDLPDDDDTTVKFQVLGWSKEFDDKDQLNLTLAPVLEHRLNAAWTFRAGYFHDLYNRDRNDRMVLFQLYYFGKGSSL